MYFTSRGEESPTRYFNWLGRNASLGVGKKRTRTLALVPSHQSLIQASWGLTGQNPPNPQSKRPSFKLIQQSTFEADRL
jgi:hypothetical protein